MNNWPPINASTVRLAALWALLAILLVMGWHFVFRQL